jgi:hypothetical protein
MEMMVIERTAEGRKEVGQIFMVCGELRVDSGSGRGSDDGRRVARDGTPLDHPHPAIERFGKDVPSFHVAGHVCVG